MATTKPARILMHAADDIEAASVTPAAADAAGLSREATWHPVNIMERVTPGAIRNAAAETQATEHG